MSRITKLANRFSRLLAQQSVQAGELTTALRDAGYWDQSKLSADISPLLAVTKVPDTSSVAIKLLVSPGFAVSFKVEIDDPALHKALPQEMSEQDKQKEQAKIDALKKTLMAASKNLESLLASKYSVAISKVLQSSGLAVADTVEVPWINF